jgi:hypothetical protein
MAYETTECSFCGTTRSVDAKYCPNANCIYSREHEARKQREDEQKKKQQG